MKPTDKQLGYLANRLSKVNLKPQMKVIKGQEVNYAHHYFMEWVKENLEMHEVSNLIGALEGELNQDFDELLIEYGYGEKKSPDLPSHADMDFVLALVGDKTFKPRTTR